MGTGCSSDYKPVPTTKAPVVPGLKIVIIGDCEVGKTSICTRFLQNQFSPLYIPTNKVIISNLVQKINQPSHALVSMTIWDTPGREEINLHSRYFRDVDAIIVVVDLTDDTSIRMAPVWKQLALNSATVTGDDDRLPGTLQVPVLLIGNKLDVIEEQLFTRLSAEESAATECEPKTGYQQSRLEIEKPDCIQLLEEVADKSYFAGCAVVSAKHNDGSVIQAFKAFLRNLMENHGNLTRRWLKPSSVFQRDKKSRDRLGHFVESVGIQKFDDLFSQGQVLVTRVMSLTSHYKDTQEHFQKLCQKAHVVAEVSCSLEDCLVGLREVYAKVNVQLKLSISEGFCQLKTLNTADGKIEKHTKHALKAFNREFAAVCISSLKELPTLCSSLETLDLRLDGLCAEFHLPQPACQGSAPDGSSSQCDNNNDDSSNINNNNQASVNLKAVSHTIEKNRGLLLHAQRQAKELKITIENSLRRVRTAFAW